MKLAQFKTKTSDIERLGLLSEGKVIDLAALAVAVNQAGGEIPAWLPGATHMLEVINRGDEALTTIQALLDDARLRGIPTDEPLAFAPDLIDFLPAVQAGKILAIGRNYEDHALEGGSEPPAAPLIFNKLINSLSAHNAPIVLPAISSQVDYEAELAVVIGCRAKRVSESEALDYIFGYTLVNDVSARDLQFGDGQWVRGKGLDGFAPLGPFITTRDEIRDVHSLNIEGRLNGETMQSSNTAKMIFRVPYLISYISQ